MKVYNNLVSLFVAVQEARNSDDSAFAAFLESIYTATKELIRSELSVLPDNWMAIDGTFGDVLGGSVIIYTDASAFVRAAAKPLRVERDPRNHQVIYSYANMNDMGADRLYFPAYRSSELEVAQREAAAPAPKSK